MIGRRVFDIFCFPGKSLSYATRRLCLCLAFLVGLQFSGQIRGQQVKDSDRLGMALDYFKSGKYHEALLLFEQLDKTYKLNPRFHAYMGLCYYQEWDYEHAVGMFDGALPQLSSLSPHELSVYYYARAESLFSLGKYDTALADYEHVLTLCYDKEKADCYYRIGFCLMQKNEWSNAAEALTSALAYYRQYLNTPDHYARIRQTENMLKGCKAKAKTDTIQNKGTLKSPLDSK